MVPVVYGGANYSLVVSTGSYIDARTFESPRALAKYLLHLDTHPAKYAQYFEWKRTYYVDVSQTQGWCDLCSRQYTDTDTFRTYRNLTHWWYGTNRDGWDRLVPKRNACEAARLEFRDDGWLDVSKNGLYFVAGHAAKFPNESDYPSADGYE